MPSSVPITTNTSPARRISAGPGEARTSSSRTIATIDAPGAGPGPGVAEWPVDERAAGPDRHLPRVESRYFAGQVGESFGDPRRAQNLSQRFGLLIGQPEDLPGLIGIVLGIHDDLEISGAPGDNADAVAVAVLELEPQADAGQQYLFDIHGSQYCCVERRLMCELRRFLDAESTFGRFPAGRTEDVAEPVAPTRRPAYVAGDRHVLVRLQLPDVEGIDLLGQPVVRTGVFGLEAAEQPVPQDEDAAVIPVQVLLVHAVVHPVMRRRVEDEFDGPPKLSDALGVDPELIDEIDREAGEHHPRRDAQQRQQCHAGIRRR